MKKPHGDHQKPDENDILRSQIERGKVVDFGAALARLDGSRELLADMIGFFQEDVPELLASMESGLKSDDAPLVKRSAHSIKGLASSFDAERVCGHCLRIERLAEDERLAEVPSCLPGLKAALLELQRTFAESRHE